MKFRSYSIPLIIFIANIILLFMLLFEMSGIQPVNHGGLGFFVPFLSFLSFQYIRAQQRKRNEVSRGLSMLQVINAFTFILPFVIFIVFLVKFL
ncbi:hypothetical protein [Halobacillus sp. Marseille-Q1614]|uniref:hypothetical protein n=1 Tax=Halobacillus sp. Marseille-Q1614 TaxID=2709134 RepID=UPI001570F02F|nr:hypothetical protein [Halobacillus sp. Marseille-Q1614]